MEQIDSKPFITESLRIRVFKDRKESICLRAEVFGCGIPKGKIRKNENYNSYKQMLKKHTRDIAGYSLSKEATLISAKKDDFIYF